jgi:hypothetical protein
MNEEPKQSCEVGYGAAVEVGEDTVEAEKGGLDLS